MVVTLCSTSRSPGDLTRVGRASTPLRSHVLSCTCTQKASSTGELQVRLLGCDTHILTLIHTHTLTQMLYTKTHTHAIKLTHSLTHTLSLSLLTHSHTHTHTHIYTHIYTSTHLTHTNTYARRHTQTNTNTPSHWNYVFKILKCFSVFLMVMVFFLHIVMQLVSFAVKGCWSRYGAVDQCSNS